MDVEGKHHLAQVVIEYWVLDQQCKSAAQHHAALAHLEQLRREKSAQILSLLPVHYPNMEPDQAIFEALGYMEMQQAVRMQGSQKKTAKFELFMQEYLADFEQIFLAPLRAQSQSGFYIYADESSYLAYAYQCVYGAGQAVYVPMSTVIVPLREAAQIAERAGLSVLLERISQVLLTLIPWDISAQLYHFNTIRDKDLVGEVTKILRYMVLKEDAEIFYKVLMLRLAGYDSRLHQACFAKIFSCDADNQTLDIFQSIVDETGRYDLLAESEVRDILSQHSLPCEIDNELQQIVSEKLRVELLKRRKNATFSEEEAKYYASLLSRIIPDVSTAEVGAPGPHFVKANSERSHPLICEKRYTPLSVSQKDRKLDADKLELFKRVVNDKIISTWTKSHKEEDCDKSSVRLLLHSEIDSCALPKEICSELKLFCDVLFDAYAPVEEFTSVFLMDDNIRKRDGAIELFQRLKSFLKDPIFHAQYFCTAIHTFPIAIENCINNTGIDKFPHLLVPDFVYKNINSILQILFDEDLYDELKEICSHILNITPTYKDAWFYLSKSELASDCVDAAISCAFSAWPYILGIDDFRHYFEILSCCYSGKDMHIAQAAQFFSTRKLPRVLANSKGVDENEKVHSRRYEISLLLHYIPCNYRVPNEEPEEVIRDIFLHESGAPGYFELLGRSDIARDYRRFRSLLDRVSHLNQ